MNYNERNLTMLRVCTLVPFIEICTYMASYLQLCQPELLLQLYKIAKLQKNVKSDKALYASLAVAVSNRSG